MTAPLPMGAQKITGMADPTVATDGATKNYVDTTTAAFFSTGDVKLTLKNVADSGWLLFNDGTFGSSASGATVQNNATQTLFTLLFNNLSDTAAPLLTSGGGGTTRAGQVSASNAWAANCRMSLPLTLGRALGVAGSGAGLTARTLGQIVGSETLSLVRADLPQTSVPVTITDPGHIHAGNAFITSVNNGGGSSQGNLVNTVGGSPAGSLTSSAVTGISAAFNLNGNVAQTSPSQMQPTSFMNCMVKM